MNTALSLPNWQKIYEGSVHTPDRDQELVPISRETARLARSAIRECQARDAYDNYSAAERELGDALAAGAPDPRAN